MRHSRQGSDTAHAPAPPVDAAYLLARGWWVALGAIAVPPAFLLHEGAHLLAARACGFRNVTLERAGVRVPALDAFWTTLDAGAGAASRGAGEVDGACAILSTAAGVVASFAVLLGAVVVVALCHRSGFLSRARRSLCHLSVAIGAVSMLRLLGVVGGGPPRDEWRIAAWFGTSAWWLVVPELAVGVAGICWLLRRVRPSVGPAVAWFSLLVGWSLMRLVMQFW